MRISEASFRQQQLHCLPKSFETEGEKDEAGSCSKFQLNNVVLTNAVISLNKGARESVECLQSDLRGENPPKCHRKKEKEKLINKDENSREHIQAAAVCNQQRFHHSHKQKGEIGGKTKLITLGIRPH